MEEEDVVTVVGARFELKIELQQRERRIAWAAVEVNEKVCMQ